VFRGPIPPPPHWARDLTEGDTADWRSPLPDTLPNPGYPRDAWFKTKLFCNAVQNFRKECVTANYESLMEIAFSRCGDRLRTKGKSGKAKE
jgi:hypothetical protein